MGRRYDAFCVCRCPRTGLSREARIWRMGGTRRCAGQPRLSPPPARQECGRVASCVSLAVLRGGLCHETAGVRKPQPVSHRRRSRPAPVQRKHRGTTASSKLPTPKSSGD